ncbi:hypothetical protein C6T69_04975 [Burkholderia multivorans]|nr:hypothetical protein C6T69_04975 [Burkholderia multivorans]
MLVNNTASIPMAPLAAITTSLWRPIMAINVDAPFLLAQTFSAGMIERGWGCIVDLASSTQSVRAGHADARILAHGTRRLRSAHCRTFRIGGTRCVAAIREPAAAQILVQVNQIREAVEVRADQRLPRGIQIGLRAQHREVAVHAIAIAQIG